MLPKNRPPTPPGEMLLEEYLKPRGITQVELAAQMGVPIQRVNTIINGKRGITAETAILLSEALNTSPEIWMGLQANHDLWHALRKRAVARGRPRKSRGQGKHQAA
jgi:antitoxin HigA-1